MLHRYVFPFVHIDDDDDDDDDDTVVDDDDDENLNDWGRGADAIVAVPVAAEDEGIRKSNPQQRSTITFRFSRMVVRVTLQADRTCSKVSIPFDMDDVVEEAIFPTIIGRMRALNPAIVRRRAAKRVR